MRPSVEPPSLPRQKTWQGKDQLSLDHAYPSTCVSVFTSQSLSKGTRMHMLASMHASLSQALRVPLCFGTRTGKKGGGSCCHSLVLYLNKQ